jgi:hypothetical protein
MYAFEPFKQYIVANVMCSEKKKKEKKKERKGRGGGFCEKMAIIEWFLTFYHLAKLRSFVCV